MKKKVVNKKKSAPKKQVKKLPKKAATVKKATKKVAKKAVKKVSEKATKKVVKKAVKKIPEKLPKEKVAKKATEEAVLSAEPEKVEEAEESPVEESKPASFGFTMDDIQTYLKENKPAKTEKVELVKATVVKKVKAPVDLVAKPKKRVLAAASIADILGFNPEDKKKTFAERKESEVPSKWLSYYRSLVKLRDHLSDDIVKHSEETLKKNSKDDSGNLSSYSQHLADAGTESFDRDMALDLVHNEQNALADIDAAIQRIFDGTYGVCEHSGKAINVSRLKVVPFTRFSLEGQQEFEKLNKKGGQNFQGNVFEEAINDFGKLSDGNADE